MSLLEKEILKYEKKGFKVVQKRTLKYGSRTFLKKKGSFLGGFEGVYIYSLDGDATTDSLRECFKDYVKFYEAEEFDEGDKGFFICSGYVDEKLFKDLRKAMIRDETTRNTMKLISPKETKKEVFEEEQPRRKVEEIEGKVPKFESILQRVKAFSPHKKPEKEKELENMLVSYLEAFFPHQIRTQMTYEKARIDAQIGKIGIEIKYKPNASELNRLYGQVEGYCRHLDRVIVVIGYEKSREDTEAFEQRLRQRNWLNSKVFLVTIR